MPVKSKYRNSPNKTVRMELSLTPEAKAALFAEAEARGISSGTLIRLAVAKYVATERAENAL